MLSRLMLCTWVPLTLAAAMPRQHPDLSGRWTLNASQSEEPQDITQLLDSTGDMSPPPRPPVGGRPGGGVIGTGGSFPGGMGGFPGAGGGGRRRGGDGGAPEEGARGSGMSPEERARMRQTFALALSAPTVLTISETDSTLTLVPPNGAGQVLHPDGRKVTQPVEGEGDIEWRCRWHGADLVVERKVSGGGKVTETYRTTEDGKQLNVAVSVAGIKGRSLKFRRVYDRAT